MAFSCYFVEEIHGAHHWDYANSLARGISACQCVYTGLYTKKTIQGSSYSSPSQHVYALNANVLFGQDEFIFSYVNILLQSDGKSKVAIMAVPFACRQFIWTKCMLLRNTISDLCDVFFFAFAEFSLRLRRPWTRKSRQKRGANRQSSQCPSTNTKDGLLCNWSVVFPCMSAFHEILHMHNMMINNRSIYWAGEKTS